MLLTIGSIINEESCFKRIINELNPIDYEIFKNSKLEFYVGVINVKTGRVEYIKIDN